MNRTYYLTRSKQGDYALFADEPMLCEDGYYRSANGCLANIFFKDAGLQPGEMIKLVIG